MSVERSVFSDNSELAMFLRKNYGMEDCFVLKIDEGSANCYKIENARGSFFLKEFQKKFDRCSIEREIEVCKLVRDIGVPTSEFIAGLDNKYVFEYNGHCFHLQKFIEGYMFAGNDFNDEVLYESAELLGKINLGLANIDFLPEGFPDKWFEDWTIEKSLKKQKDILESIKASKRTTEEKEKIIEACQEKINLLKIYNKDYLKYKNLKIVNSHGDYSRLQILCDIAKNKINAVIDFSGAASVPAVWEIIRSYSYGAKECINGSNIDLIKFKKYIEKYLKYGKLDLFDISNMAGFYYYNLLRSTYGLNSENRNLNDFAIWRTGLCKYLSESYNDIDLYLFNEFRGSVG